MGSGTWCETVVFSLLVVSSILVCKWYAFLFSKSNTLLIINLVFGLLKTTLATSLEILGKRGTVNPFPPPLINLPVVRGGS